MEWLTPRDPDELRELLDGRAEDARPLLPTGAGEAPPGLSAAAEADDASVVSTAALAGVRELRPRDLTVDAGAGTRVRDLLTALAAEGVWMPLGGPALGMSVGGLAAAAPPGPFDGSYGDLKRQLLACGLVAWDGTALRWGRAVMKDVAGYSMVRSVAGSFGRTGVVHRATFRLWPAPEALAAPSVRPGGGTADALAAAGALATSDADASVRPDAAVWSRSPGEGGRLEVRLVGSADSVSLRLGKLRAWAADRGAGLEGGGPAAFDPLAAGGEAEGASAPGPAAFGPARDPDVGVASIRAGRGGFEEAARRTLRALGEDAVGLEGYPLAGHLRCAWRRPPRAAPGDGPAGAAAAGPFARLLGALDDAAVRVERGSAAELEAAGARRAEAARRLEARVLEGLGGRPRHWLSAYL